MLRAEAKELCFSREEISPKIRKINVLANRRKGCHPRLAAPEHLDRAAVISPQNLVIGDPDLQDCPEELSDRSFFLAPGELERLMGFKIAALVEKA